MTKAKKPSKVGKTRSREVVFSEMCEGLSQTVHAMQQLTKNIWQRESALVDYLAENQTFGHCDNLAAQRISQYVKLLNEAMITMIREDDLKVYEKAESIIAENLADTLNLPKEDFISRLVVDGYINAIKEGVITKKNRDKSFSKGRKTANDRRAKNASMKNAALDKAVADYLDKAEKDGLDKTNKGIFTALQNTPLRMQLKKPNNTEYTDLTFARDIAFAARNWRREQKQKTTI